MPCEFQQIYCVMTSVLHLGFLFLFLLQVAWYEVSFSLVFSLSFSLSLSIRATGIDSLWETCAVLRFVWNPLAKIPFTASQIPTSAWFPLKSAWPSQIDKSVQVLFYPRVLTQFFTFLSFPPLFLSLSFFSLYFLFFFSLFHHTLSSHALCASGRWH